MSNLQVSTNDRNSIHSSVCKPFGALISHKHLVTEPHSLNGQSGLNLRKFEKTSADYKRLAWLNWLSFLVSFFFASVQNAPLILTNPNIQTHLSLQVLTQKVRVLCPVPLHKAQGDTYISVTRQSHHSSVGPNRHRRLRKRP